MPSIRLHPEVADALDGGLPVVALESAVITSGLPREPLPAFSRLRAMGWTGAEPLNLECARRMQQTVRDHGAIPAIIAIINGDLRIGLNDDDLASLATAKAASKASVTDLAAVVAEGGCAGTTVSATLAACGLAHSTYKASATNVIRVFATGGIGGVHRHWQTLPDVSADLRQIASTAVCVVCSGAKSILDLPATVESLETLGVPVVGYRTARFPQFLCEGDDQLRLPRRVEQVNEMARLCRIHWEMLGQTTGVILANPPPAEMAMTADELGSAIEQAERNAAAHHIAGAARTPFLLMELAHLTAGRSLDANLALLIGNAGLAAELAAAMGTGIV